MILALLLALQPPPLEPPLVHHKIKSVSYQRTYDDLCMMSPHACIGIQPSIVPFTEARIGTDFDFHVYSSCGGPDPSPYLLIRSRFTDKWAGLDLPISLDMLGAPECWRYVGDGVAVVRPYSHDETISIPDVPELVGQVFYFQAFFRINDWTAAINNANPIPWPWWYVMPEVRWASTQLMIVTISS
jgi:hypothetical protein